VGKRKLFIGGLVILVAVVFLGYQGFKSSVTYYYEVNELLNQGSSIYGQNVRVGGEVAPGVEQNVESLLTRFTIIDINNREVTLPVEYKGALPDTFNEGRHVLIEGKYSPTGVFEASQVLTKCSSKYIPAQDETGK